MLGSGAVRKREVRDLLCWETQEDVDLEKPNWGVGQESLAEVREPACLIQLESNPHPLQPQGYDLGSASPYLSSKWLQQFFNSSPWPMIPQARG